MEEIPLLSKINWCDDPKTPKRPANTAWNPSDCRTCQRGCRLNLAAIPLIIHDAFGVCGCVGADVFEFFADLWQRLIKEIAQSSPLHLFLKLFASVAAIALIYYVQKLVRKRFPWARTVFSSFWASHRKIIRIRDAVHEQGPGLWLAIKHNSHPPSPIDTLRNVDKLILTVANLKGGVGKTTLTANLAAFFANPFNDSSRPSRRILVVDLDFPVPEGRAVPGIEEGDSLLRGGYDLERQRRRRLACGGNSHGRREGVLRAERDGVHERKRGLRIGGRIVGIEVQVDHAWI